MDYVTTDSLAVTTDSLTVTIDSLAVTLTFDLEIIFVSNYTEVVKLVKFAQVVCKRLCCQTLCKLTNRCKHTHTHSLSHGQPKHTMPSVGNRR